MQEITQEMAEGRKQRRRGWVKNAIIVFLAVMLALTFFSNTILNYSLAEVATSRTSSGSITTKIRGTGVVQAGEIYSVEVGETRRIKSVVTAVGDTVGAGDTLFLLEDQESEELALAQDALAARKMDYQKALLDMSPSNYAVENNTVSELKEDYQKTVNERAVLGASVMSVTAAAEAVRLAQNNADELSAQKTVLEGRLASLADGAEDGGEATALAGQLADVSQKLIEAESALRAAQNTLERETSIQSADNAVTAAERALTQYQLSLAATKASDQAALTKAQLDLNAMADEIAALEKQVAVLAASAVGGEITARSGGVVSTINVTAGSNTTPGTPLATIEMTDIGYTAQISLTTQQAKDFKPGDKAEVTTGSWWGPEVQAVIQSVRDDPESPGTGKIVTFALEGEVTSGETLNFTLSQKTANYDVIVPNSAIHTDNNGTFVLLITEKNSPLGTRYAATRVDVTVLASDDTNSGVSGGLTAWDNVITTASKTVQPGDYVRLAEGA